MQENRNKQPLATPYPAVKRLGVLFLQAELDSEKINLRAEKQTSVSVSINSFLQTFTKLP